jgi:hypothetical protein
MKQLFAITVPLGVIIFLILGFLSAISGNVQTVLVHMTGDMKDMLSAVLGIFLLSQVIALVLVVLSVAIRRGRL